MHGPRGARHDAWGRKEAALLVEPEYDTAICWAAEVAPARAPWVEPSDREPRAGTASLRVSRSQTRHTAQPQSSNNTKTVTDTPHGAATIKQQRRTGSGPCSGNHMSQPQARDSLAISCGKRGAILPGAVRRDKSIQSLTTGGERTILGVTISFLIDQFLQQRYTKDAV